MRAVGLVWLALWSGARRTGLEGAKRAASWEVLARYKTQGRDARTRLHHRHMPPPSGTFSRQRGPRTPPMPRCCSVVSSGPLKTHWKDAQSLDLEGILRPSCPKQGGPRRHPEWK